MDIAAFPTLCTVPAPFIRYQEGAFYTYGVTGHMFLLGNVGIMEKTLELFERVIRIREHGSDELGMSSQSLGVFHIEPGKQIWLWIFDHRKRNYRVPTPPHWLNMMKPVLEAALVHAKEKPCETQVFIPDEQRGWRYGSLCND